MCTPILTRHWFRLLVWGASTPQHSQMCEDGPPCKVSEKAFGPQCWKLKVRPLWLKCQSQGNTGRVEFLILAPNLFLLHEVNEWTLTTLLLDTKLTQTYSAPSLHSHTHTHTLTTLTQHLSVRSQHWWRTYLLCRNTVSEITLCIPILQSPPATPGTLAGYLGSRISMWMRDHQWNKTVFQSPKKVFMD